jgi:hypothetical protein
MRHPNKAIAKRNRLSRTFSFKVFGMTIAVPIFRVQGAANRDSFNLLSRTQWRDPRRKQSKGAPINELVALF